MSDEESENLTPTRVESDVPDALQEALSEPEVLPSGPRGDGPPAGRDMESGRFLPGNRLGRGSPLAGKAAKLRAALFKAVGQSDITEILRALIGKAKAGDTVAARIVLAYTLGEPVALDLVEKIEQLEAVYVKSRG
jgi:hypothetical protein